MIIAESLENNTIQPDFKRATYDTIAEMKAVSKKTMPYTYIATCKETAKAYIYSKSNTEDETLGFWREIGAGEVNPLKYSLLTQEEYNALEIKDNDTLYLIKEA